MILHEFPNLSWLKDQINSGFSNRRGWGNHDLGAAGFPSVIINTSATECYRPDVKGPLSLFLNLKGNSLCTVDGNTRVVNEGHYFISNQAQSYTLQIEKSETFNIHFGDYLADRVLNAMLTPADRVLDNGATTDNGSSGGCNPVSFIPQLYRRNKDFDKLINGLLVSYQEHGFQKLLFEEQLSSLLVYLLQQHRQILGKVEKLPPLKQSTRLELYKRLSSSIDIIHSTLLFRDLDLETLSSTACLSKYHYLRLFRLAYGLTPHQYIQELRIEKARDLLACSNIPVSDLSDSLGFANPQSFSRLFFQRVGLYPSHFREIKK
ncbi:helix-turn-helix domain-containing protein [Flavitalea flava]